MGAGHVMRCLALAQSWHDQGDEVHWVTAGTLGRLREQIAAEGAPVSELHVHPGSAADADATARLAAAAGARWVVVDGYHFDTDFRRRVRQAAPVLQIDDFARSGEGGADLVLDSSPLVTPPEYSRSEPGADLLLGVRYALLRREFRDRRTPPADTPPLASRLLVTLGGADAGNQAERVARAALRLGGLEVAVVAGGLNPHRKSLDALAVESGGRLAVSHAATDMARRMAEAHLAVAGAGITAVELACTGLPALLLILADNQRPNARWAERDGFGRNLGEEPPADAVAASIAELIADPVARQEMAAAGRRAVDGQGAERVAMLLSGAAVRLRPAQAGDAELLHRWASDAQTRASSFHPAPIPWPDHQRWLADVLEDESRWLLIGLDRDDRPVGQVRLDLDREGATTISLSVAPEHRGRGIGTALIEASLRLARRSFGRVVVHAWIKPDNRASLVCFERAGFERLGEETVSGVPAYHYHRRIGG
jgi:UDP-2,4-diacetamido-2,4,6-trideoxy-beta-L-altropyranose hydrolase